MSNTNQKQYDRNFIGLATAAAFASLLAYAVILFITPASNNEIAKFYHASLSKLAQLPLALASSFVVAALCSGGLSDRRGKLPIIFVGCISLSVGAFLFGSTSTFTVAIIASSLMGIGGGLTESTSMALVGDLFANSKRTAMLNLSQAMFGVGAVLAPVGIGALLGAGLSWRLGYYGASAICAVSAILAGAALAARQEKPLGRQENGSDWRNLISDSIIVWLSIGILLYVGAELGQSTWMAVYFKRDLGAAGPLSASSLSVMWIGIGVGRIAAAWASRHMRETSMICWCSALAAVSETALLFLHVPIPALVAAFFLGVFLGPIFPTIVSCAGAIYPRQSGAVTAIVVAMGGVGSATFPPVIGTAADHIGLRPALWVCVVVLMLNLFVFLSLRKRNI